MALRSCSPTGPSHWLGSDDRAVHGHGPTAWMWLCRAYGPRHLCRWRQSGRSVAGLTGTSTSQSCAAPDWRTASCASRRKSGLPAPVRLLKPTRDQQRASSSTIGGADSVLIITNGVYSCRCTSCCAADRRFVVLPPSAVRLRSCRRCHAAPSRELILLFISSFRGRKEPR